MRLPLSLANAEALFDYGEIVVRLTVELLYEIDGRAFQNSYSGAVLVGIRRALAISGLQIPLQSVNGLMKS
jgi:hypothetical protein